MKVFEGFHYSSTKTISRGRKSTILLQAMLYKQVMLNCALSKEQVKKETNQLIEQIAKKEKNKDFKRTRTTTDDKTNHLP